MISRLYFDPIDEPAPANTVLITYEDDKRLKFYGSFVEDCLRSVLKHFGESGEDVIFRRVDDEDSLAMLRVWDVAVPAATIKNRASAARRLLGCYQMITSFRRSITTSPELAARYGILEVYILSDEMGDNCSYLDRTGKIRPLAITVPGDAIESVHPDEAFVREEIEAAIVHAMEPIYPYSR